MQLGRAASCPIRCPSSEPPAVPSTFPNPTSNSRPYHPSLTAHAKPPPPSPTAAFHEYRYDWTPSSVTFYADSTPLTTMNTTSAIPDSPGHLSFSHWSNGDPAWSGGPPAQDAILTVSYFKAFFNASSAPAAPANGCGYGNPAARGVCAVPDLTGAPDGNASAWAAWYGSPGGTEPGGEVGKKGAAQRLGVGMSGMLMLVSVVVCLRVVGP